MKKFLTLIALLFSMQVHAQWHHLQNFHTYTPGSMWHISADLLDFVFFDDATGIAETYYFSGTPMTGTSIYYTLNTSDYGNTWDSITGSMGGSGIVNYKLQRLSNSDSVVRYSLNAFEVSGDRGASWLPLSAIHAHVSDFISAQYGLMYNYPNLYKFKNGTTTLLSYTSPAGYPGITDIQMISKAKAFMIDDNRQKLMMSNDSGFTWTTALDTSTYFNHIDFMDEFTGYISCDSGQVYKTTDGGTSWNLLNTGTTKHLLWSSITNDTAFFCGQQGTIIRTKDAGLTWDDQSMSWLTRDIEKIQVIGKTGYCFDGHSLYRNDNATPVIEIEKESNAFTMYPNPARDRITIANANGEKIKSVQLLNALGQCEFSQSIESADAQINIPLPTLTPGIKYLVINGEQAYSYKLVVE